VQYRLENVLKNTVVACFDTLFRHVSDKATLTLREPQVAQLRSWLRPEPEISQALKIGNV
jgi:hypothetical protein